jgi:hypothetical protein
LVVFHTPPVADATYISDGSRSDTAMSVMRPDIVAGPMKRNRMALSAAESSDCAASGDEVASRSAIRRSSIAILGSRKRRIQG